MFWLNKYIMNLTLKTYSYLMFYWVMIRKKYEKLLANTDAIRLHKSLLIPYTYDGVQYEVIVPYDTSKITPAISVEGCVGKNSRKLRFQSGVPITVSPENCGFDKYLVSSHYSTQQYHTAPMYLKLNIEEE